MDTERDYSQEGDPMYGREGRNFQQILSDIGQSTMELYERVDLPRQLEEHPYRTLGIAAGLGYVLGGGLFTGFTGRAVGIGTRVLLLPLVQATLGQLIGELEGETPY